MATLTDINPNKNFQEQGASVFSPAQQPIDIGALTTTPKLSIPPAPAPAIPNYANVAVTPNSQNTTPPTTTSPTPTIQNTPAQDTLNAGADQLTADIAALQEKQGTKSARLNQLQTDAGLPDLNKQLNEINAQIKGIQSDAFAATNRAEDRLAPTFAISGDQAQIERQKAVRTYGLAAAAEAIQGNIALAQDHVDKALAAEFDPLQAQIDAKKTLLASNRDSFNTEEKRRADALSIQLDQQKQQLDQQRADKNAVYNVMNIAAKYGAPAAALNRILASSNEGDAIAAASSYLQDPQAKYDLESARLDNILKQAQITKTQKETAQMGQQTAAETKDAIKAEQAAKDAIPTLTDKINSISNLIDSPGLNSAVGTSFLTRGKYGPLSAIDTLSGARQDFIAGVQQLVSKDTIDTLLNVKAQGGTFGALSDQERLLLQSAATKIGTWAIHDGSGNVTGYNVDEASFKRELKTVQDLAIRARDKAVGNAGLVSPDEKQAISQFLSGSTASTPSTSFSPASYF